MKIARRYLIFAALLALGIFIKFHMFNADKTTLKEFRGGSLSESVWNPLVAANVNDGCITVSIDSHEYSSKDTDIYMDDARNIMVPTDILRDALNCSAHIYDNDSLLVEKYDYSLLFQLGCSSIELGDRTQELSSPLTQKDGKFYISLDDLSELLSYNYDFDMESRTFTTTDTAENTAALPARYDLREKGRVSEIRNQGTYGTCWAFAAASALESSLLPEQKALFSVDHMTLANSFNVNQNDGGDYTMGMAYLAAWQGPVYEEDDPYGDGVTDLSAKPVYHVQEMQIIDGKNYDAIKQAVFKYGGVQSSLYSTIQSYTTDDENYNRSQSAYCYIGTERPNHDIVIIGWDDNYPRENFNVELEGDGAFICQNSWGGNFGDDGIFYVSYYDTNIGTHNIVYTGIESTDNYDHIYQSDLCGWVGKIGYDRESIYGANVYTAEGDETITAASFYATGANSEYELYVVRNFEDASSLSDRIAVASGSLSQAGYYTIDFTTPVNVDKGEDYAIVLYISTPGATHPLAVEYDSGEEAYSSVNLKDGEGYISFNGSSFTNVMEKQDCNLCIKAFTNDRKEDQED